MKWCLLVLAPAFISCVGGGGGGGSEVGNGGDREAVVVEHGVDFARAVLARLDGRDIERLLPQGDDAAWFQARRPKSQKALDGVRAVHVHPLPKFCQGHQGACARAGEKVIYFDSEHAKRLRDYREAAALVWHESVHLGGDATEAAANRFAVLTLNAWKRLGHPEAPHWLSMAEAPLAKERITDDPDLLRYQYSDWTGEKFIVWDERSIQTYDPAADRWELARLARNPLNWRRPKGRFAHASHLWAWVQDHGVILAPCRTLFPALKKENLTGVKVARKDQAWSTVTAEGAPVERMWTPITKSNTHVYLWGGAECSGTPMAYDDGAAYDPIADRWTPIANDAQTPSPRYAHGALWTGQALVVWGGFTVFREMGKSGKAEPTNSGAFYDPATKRWTAIPITEATPSPRVSPRLAWTGSELLVFGGFDAFHGKSVQSGAAYHPATGKWRALPEASPRTALSSIEPAFTFWTGSQLGFVAREFFSFFDPAANAWNDWGRPAAPSNSLYPRLYWTGVEAIVWDPEERRGVRLYP